MKKKDELNTKTNIRWGRQQYRIEVVHLILECFSHYFMMKNHAQMARTGYKDITSAEKLSSFINDAFKQESKPDDFIITMDESSNKAIEEYEKLEEILNRYFSSTRCQFEKKDVISTLAYLYHNNIILKIRHYDFLFFVQWVQYAYQNRIKNIEELVEKSIEICVWNGGTIRHADTKLFRRIFIDIEKSLRSIQQKRLERYWKKYKKTVATKL